MRMRAIGNEALLPAAGPHNSGMLLFLLVATLLPTLSWANPLSRFLMMNMNNNKNKRQLAPASGSGQQQQQECIDPETHNGQVATLQKETEDWKRQYETAAADLVWVRSEVKRVTQVKESLQAELSQLQTQYHDDVAQVQHDLDAAHALMSTQRDEFAQQTQELQDNLRLEKQNSQEHLAESEALFNEQLESVRAGLHAEFQKTHETTVATCHADAAKRVAEATDKAAAAVEELQSWKKQYETASSDLVWVREEVQRITSVKEDLVNQMAKLQTQYSKDLSQVQQELNVARQSLASQQAAFDALELKLRDEVQLQEQLADQRVAETEALYKNEMDLVKTTAQMDIQNAQQAAQTACRDEVKDKLAAAASEAEQHGSTAAVLRVKLKVLQDENAALQSQQDALQLLVDQMEGQYAAKLAQEQATMQAHVQDQVQTACQDALAEHERECEHEIGAAMELCQEETQAQITQVEETAAEKLQQVANDHAELAAVLQESIATLETSLEQVNEEKKQDALLAEEESAQLKEMAIEEMTRLKRKSEQDMDQVKQELQHERDLLKTEHAQAVQTLAQEISELEQAMEELQRQHEADVEAIEARAANELEALQNETAAELRNQMEAAEERTVVMRTGLEKQITATQQLLDQQRGELRQRQTELHQLRRDLTQQKAEVEYWSTRFQNRAYVNVTHLHEDASAWWTGAQHNLTKFTTQQHAKISHELRPRLNELQAWYSKHLKDQVDPVLQSAAEQYEEHAAPHVEHARAVMGEHAATAQAFWRGMFHSVVADVRNLCPQLLRKSERAPALVHHNMQGICQNPEVAVRQSLIGAAVVVAFVLRGLILRVLWMATFGLLFFVLRILWFFCPLRLFIPSGRPRLPEETEADLLEGLLDEDEEEEGEEAVSPVKLPRRKNGKKTSQ